MIKLIGFLVLSSMILIYAADIDDLKAEIAKTLKPGEQIKVIISKSIISVNQSQFFSLGKNNKNCSSRKTCPI